MMQSRSSVQRTIIFWYLINPRVTRGRSQGGLAMPIMVGALIALVVAIGFWILLEISLAVDDFRHSAQSEILVLAQMQVHSTCV